MDIEGIAGLTRQYGGEWGIQHAKRLLHMARLLGRGLDYDPAIVELAAYLHDWGGYAPWAEPEVDHVARSLQVVEPFLIEHGYAPEVVAAVLECIANHHGGPAGRSVESILFTDADALDLLGVIGAARVFAMNHRNLRGGWEAVQRWRDMSLKALTLEPSRALAQRRVAETNEFLAAFEEEAFGMF